MQRHMNYQLDGVLSTRNQGQLVTQQTVTNKTMRLPGLKPVSMKGTGTGTKLSRQRKTSYAPGMAGCATCGLGHGIVLPLVGEVSLRDLALGAVVVIAGMYLLKRR